jgi:hypothetical protein
MNIYLHGEERMIQMITSLCTSLTLGLDAIKTTEMLVYFSASFHILRTNLDAIKSHIR